MSPELSKATKHALVWIHRRGGHGALPKWPRILLVRGETAPVRVQTLRRLIDAGLAIKFVHAGARRFALTPSGHSLAEQLMSTTAYGVPEYDDA